MILSFWCIKFISVKTLDMYLRMSKTHILYSYKINRSNGVFFIPEEMKIAQQSTLVFK